MTQSGSLIGYNQGGSFFRSTFLEIGIKLFYVWASSEDFSEGENRYHFHDAKNPCRTCTGFCLTRSVLSN
jgi:hypothetical protein